MRLAVSRLDVRNAREQLATLDVSPSAQRQVSVALAVIEHINAQLAPLDTDLKAFARAQPGCRALTRHYGIGPQVACAILAELGDTRRFSSSRQAVRFAGLDITVHESDGKRRPGHLSRQGPPVLCATPSCAQAAKCSMQVACCRCCYVTTCGPTTMQEFLRQQLDALATDRVARAFLHLGPADPALRTMAAYSDWIKLIGNKTNRNELSALDEASRHDSSLFAEVRRIGELLDNGLTGVLFESSLSHIAPKYVVL